MTVIPFQLRMSDYSLTCKVLFFNGFYQKRSRIPKDSENQIGITSMKVRDEMKHGKANKSDQDPPG